MRFMPRKAFAAASAGAMAFERIVWTKLDIGNRNILTIITAVRLHDLCDATKRTPNDGYRQQSPVTAALNGIGSAATRSVQRISCE